ncbi:transcription factor TFIIB subunit, putative [Babesia bigemina]|uniref:B-related factor 1 n=1 Tax=Babesia bigemina TaxID=5866 RepID=A0A061DD79_BABBI|nr:transcription factor TFIIB subunit, putative [Babesia bigemina]CDR96030.1 transcription factor TFIIB subunit, putative [Babesia bigemina]|eukprot:XP_012768216.1 transcription factor TFIIB subunit, putative [Babesia bigemina]
MQKLLDSCCKYCGSDQIESCKQQGELVCRNCGAVLQENNVLEAVQYAENPAGNSTLIGRFVPTGGGGMGSLKYSSSQTLDQLVRRGEQNIQRTACHLNISSELVTKATRIYSLAVQRNFTMGRNNKHVACCCLYTACRRFKAPYLLIDFADVLQVPVKIIGQVFMKLVRMLHLEVPNVDPSIFFERFANELQLKEKVDQIITTGVRLIQAMRRDWLCTGRRPTGLCGAALVVAARIHGIPLNAEAVASVVRISHPTIMKRLSEFRGTSTARLLTSEVDIVDLEKLPANPLPPCMMAKKLALEKKRRLESETGSTCSDNGRASITSGEDSPLLTSTQLQLPVQGKIDLHLSNDLLCLDAPTASDINHIADTIMGAAPQLGWALPKADGAGDGPNSSNSESIVPKAALTTIAIPQSRADGHLSSDDEDDEREFSFMILSPDEKAAKTLLWDEVTKDIMPEVWRRQAERKRKEALGKTIKKRKYCRKSYADYPEAQNAAQSARMALERHAKDFSNRMNQEFLDTILA